MHGLRLTGLWRDPDFIKMWAGRIISELGSHITGSAVPLIAVLVLNAAPSQVGLLSALGSAPVLVIGLFAGVWVDRLRRRPLLIAADLARAAILATIPLAALLGGLSVAQLYAVIILTGALSVIFDVADQSYLPSLVRREQLVEANSKLAATSSVAEIGGPALAGALVQLLTGPIAIIFDALSYVVSAVSLGLIRRPEPQPGVAAGQAAAANEANPEPHGASEAVDQAAGPVAGRSDDGGVTEGGPAEVGPAASGVWAEIAGGLRFVWQDRRLRALMGASATLEFFGNFFGALYMIYLVRVIGATPLTIGILIGLGGVSSLPGALLAGSSARRFGMGRTLVGSLLIWSCLTLLIPLAPPRAGAGPALPLAILMLGAAQLLADWAGTIYFITELSLRQGLTPDHLLGRMNASVRTVVGGVAPLGALAAGLLGDLIGMRPTLFVAAAGSMLAVLWLLASPLPRERWPITVAVSQPVAE
jgi:MFS family permease